MGQISDHSISVIRPVIREATTISTAFGSRVSRAAETVLKQEKVRYGRNHICIDVSKTEKDLRPWFKLCPFRFRTSVGVDAAIQCR